ncbi:Rdx family protein [Giardia muris]|uniref:Rdx family protein n=1 Tax=Giardia muris TaxID=5742 RepID=A0A4Z1SVS4_GIAMU|nr:Rdx family protein [Giardia muris]|eukprot:TNJ29876.1 Rdx family protein [Giardia muris]
MQLRFVMCMQCGSRPRYDGIRQYFKKQNVEADFEFEPGPDGSFEIYLDGKQIYSKLSTGQYPTPPELLELIRKEQPAV